MPRKNDWVIWKFNCIHVTVISLSVNILWGLSEDEISLNNFKRITQFRKKSWMSNFNSLSELRSINQSISQSICSLFHKSSLSRNFSSFTMNFWITHNIQVNNDSVQRSFWQWWATKKLNMVLNLPTNYIPPRAFLLLGRVMFMFFFFWLYFGSLGSVIDIKDNFFRSRLQQICLSIHLLFMV